MNSHSDVDKAIEAEMRRGSALLDQSVESLGEFKDLLVKFKLYRNSSKFTKVTFEDFNPNDESDEENIDDVHIPQAVDVVDDSGMNARYDLDILSVSRRIDSSRQVHDSSKINMPKYLPNSLLFEKVHNRTNKTSST
jgi:hypothetical protein